MNQWLASKPLALGRSFLAAPVKLTSIGQFSVTRNAAGYGFLLLTKMMMRTVAANGESKKKKKLPVLLKPKKFIQFRRGWVVKHDIEAFPRWRSNEEIRRMFEEWTVLFGKVYANAEEKETRYDVFKGKVRFIEENDRYSTNQRLGLDYFSDMTPKEYFTMKAEEDDQRVTSILAARSNLMSMSGMGMKNICGAASDDKDESTNKSPSPFSKQTEIYLEDFISMRNNMEIAAMFHIWCVDQRINYASEAYKMTGFTSFKSYVKFVEETNAKISEPDSRLLLNGTADWSPKYHFDLMDDY